MRALRCTTAATPLAISPPSPSAAASSSAGSPSPGPPPRRRSTTMSRPSSPGRRRSSPRAQVAELLPVSMVHERNAMLPHRRPARRSGLLQPLLHRRGPGGAGGRHGRPVRLRLPLRQGRARFRALAGADRRSRGPRRLRDLAGAGPAMPRTTPASVRALRPPRRCGPATPRTTRASARALRPPGRCGCPDRRREGGAGPRPAPPPARPSPARRAGFPLRDRVSLA